MYTSLFLGVIQQTDNSNPAIVNTYIHTKTMNTNCLFKFNCVEIFSIYRATVKLL